MQRTKEVIIKDLDDCQKMILKLKAEPVHATQTNYRGLLLDWTRRRDELKKELTMFLSTKIAKQIVFERILQVQHAFN